MFLSGSEAAFLHGLMLLPAPSEITIKSVILHFNLQKTTKDTKKDRKRGRNRKEL